jgi:uncharacterized protein (DUF608 family)
MPTNLPPDRTLFAKGKPRSFTGRALREIAFPLGGIGTGTVSLGGRGELRDWEIFNRPAKGLTLPQTFVALWARERGRKAVTRVVAARPLPPFTGHSGVPREGVPGLPHFTSARFTGTYPIARIDFEEDSLPVEVTLEAFNPLIPLRAEDSGIPVAILTYHLTNRARRRVEATLALSALNPVGYLPPAPLTGRRAPCFGGNVNTLHRGAITAIHMTSERLSADDLAFGSLAIATTHSDTTHRLDWGGGAWFDDLQTLWDELSDSGRLAEQARMEPTPEGETEHATLGARVTLAPGESVPLTFFITWHVPNRDNHWNTEESVRGAPLRNAYADRFEHALDVAQHTVRHLWRLETQTRQFRVALFASTLPRHALDAISANLSTLRTNTCLWLDDGRLHGFEGCLDDTGCCPMDCTHVWNYSQAEAFLFPTLARSMRETDFGWNVDDRGEMAFRTLLPIGRERWNFRAAADGQLGTIVRLFREWNLSGDDEFLHRLWPAARRTMDFALRTFDPDGDGVPEGERHNTYDIEFIGQDPLTATMMLAALRAMQRMGEAVGDTEMAGRCERLLTLGVESFLKLCWNGEYFEQRIDDPDQVKYQVGAGCLSDQLLGEWMSRFVGMGPLLPGRETKRAARAVFRHGWKQDLSGHACCQRSYAMEGEPGLLLCTWPRGGRPRFPFPYSDEVWTGIEYAVAALLIDLGLVREGLAVVWGARSRHDGERRNPWDESECGHHYVRAMSSWSLLTALSGFRCSVPEGMLAFDPRVTPERFQTLWSCGTAWGVYRQRTTQGKTRAEIEVMGGILELETLRLGPRGVTERFSPARTLKAGDSLRVEI